MLLILFMSKMWELNLATDPQLGRSMYIYQNYIGFIYLPEAYFRILRQEMPDNSATRKCARFLTDNPVRLFRNALAHANWSISDDFSGLDFWARKGAVGDEPMEKFHVGQRQLNFWQKLSTCVGNVVFSNL